MASPNWRVRPTTLLLVVLILASACIVVWRQRRVERLQAALARYKSRSHERVAHSLNGFARRLDWPTETPLGEVIELIKLFTQRGGFPLGVPIVVDLDGLEAAGASLSSPVQRPPTDPGLSLGHKLKAVLEPMGLGYHVRDATIVITAERMVDEPLGDEPKDEE